ncbi:MAG: SGNH/GDSL hydrolase family protein [Hydrogenophaga sp.]|uniref:SGNH/GDSL hydrolase family protein n=1 Tax=Hydrogenophaga sp. TaxID=1904254 RepID=UPI003D9BD99B
MLIRSRLAAALAAVLLASCGGGGSEPLVSSAGITSVKVMGDSLADSGTFEGLPGYGRIFSVQGSESEPNVIWTERTAAVLGAPQICNFFRFTGATFVVDPACSSFGVGGGRINNPADKGGANSPLSIPYQLATAATVNGSYSASDLLLIDGGGNDAADLVGAYLAAAKDSGASYQALLLTLLPLGTVGAVLPTTGGPEQAGGLYMQALADKFYDAVKTNALDKGAQRIALLNMPGITNTPRFQMVLASIEQAKGATARAQAEALFRSWISAFNQRLVAKVGSDTRVTVVDFFSSFDDQVKNPKQYGLTNVTTPACPATGVGSDGLPEYNFQTCTATALSAAPPTGVTDPNWWKTYAFADGFHPTPYGYQLLGQLVATSLAKAGWL